MHYVARKIILGTIFAILLFGLVAIARGYRFSPTKGEVKSTGILVAASNPDGAKIFINGELKGATNSNISLAPGTYTVEIKKDGFTSWKRELRIKGELVIKADALLFPQNPTLSPVTSLGVTAAYASPSGDKIIIISESGDPEEDGIYLLENVRNPLSRINPLNTLVLKTAFKNHPADLKLSSVSVEFSPDEKELVIQVPAADVNSTPTSYLIDTNTVSETLFNVTTSLDTIHEAWKQQQAELHTKTLKAFKKPLAKVALSSFDILAFSPDETKILYTATQSATIPQIIKPALVAVNQTPEIRTIEPGNIYVYDAEEDRNYRLFSTEDFVSTEAARTSIVWYPSSTHFILKERTKISVIDFDGSNKRTVYSGPFSQSFLATSKDGRLFIMTNFNSEAGTLQDIYSIGLK